MLDDLAEGSGPERARRAARSSPSISSMVRNGVRVLADVVDAADGGMGDLAREPDLLDQPLALQSVGAVQILSATVSRSMPS